MKQIKGGSQEDFLNTIGMTAEQYSNYEKENYTNNPSYSVSEGYFVKGKHYEYNGITIKCLLVDPYGNDDIIKGIVTEDKNNLTKIGTIIDVGKGFYTLKK